MTRIHRLATVAVALALAAGCVAGCNDAFDGANVQFDFSPAMPVQASLGEAGPSSGEIDAASHFTFYAIQIDDEAHTDRMYAVATFEVHHIVDLGSPCFIDVGPHVPHPGLHVSQYAKVIGQDTGIPDVTNPPPTATEAQKVEAATAVQREDDVALLAGPMGMHAITSTSAAVYPPVAATCAAAAADATMIPPPTCTDDASNAQRLALCQAAWSADPDLWEGTDRILTSPLAGTTRGFVDGDNPITLSPVGGAQFFVDTVLRDADAFAVYVEPDASAGSGTGTGTQLLYGTPALLTRGVLHVHMTNELSPALTADVAIFADLDDDDTHF
jgi:hypothetical protein